MALFRTAECLAFYIIDEYITWIQRYSWKKTLMCTGGGGGGAMGSVKWSRCNR